VSAAPGLVFITGASSGIGQALARRYAQAGWRLALAPRGRLERLGPGPGLGQRALACRADVAQVDSIVAAAQACLAQQGVPDVVIANAGISIGVDTVRGDLQVMARIFATNNLGLAASFQPFIEPMRQRGSGTLVGIASVAGIRGLPGHGAYCASKAAVISYCESLRGELRGSGVRVVTLLPGYVDTPLTRGNRYPMPFLMAPEAFARRAQRVIAAGASYRVIPWPMGVAARLLRLLPNALFDRLPGAPRARQAAKRAPEGPLARPLPDQ
jgi:NAD(P)-dependent dehydrogenase (short-subunit alcohol dehydrogenase family)